MELVPDLLDFRRPFELYLFSRRLHLHRPHLLFRHRRPFFNKQLTKQNLKKTKIEIIKSEVLNIKNINKKKMKDIYDQYESFVIKPVSSGSSFGVKIFKNFNDIKFFNKNISKYLKLYKKHPQLLIEKYIPGRELTVTVFKDKKQYQPIAVTEIISSNPFS